MALWGIDFERRFWYKAERFAGIPLAQREAACRRTPESRMLKAGNMEELSEVQNEETAEAEAEALSAEEQEQFAAWLARQDPSKRKQYMKLAQAYGFKPSGESV